MRLKTIVRIFTFIGCVCCVQPTQAQVGLGVTYGFDFYQYQANPVMPFRPIKRGLGSPLFNLNIGPKLWVGGKGFSVALEGQIGIAPFAMDVNEYKGLGAFYFPKMASFNLNGLSGFQEKGGWGIGIAAGSQFTRTDLYFLDEQYGALNRRLFQTYFGQVNIGLGSKASIVYLYARYGVGDEETKNFHVGLMFEQNLILRKKMKKREIVD